MDFNKEHTKAYSVSDNSILKKRRRSNLELYRIIVMLSIVAHHYVVNSGLFNMMDKEPTMSVNSLFFYIFGMWVKTGINCFVMITGYFMCTSNITIQKFFKLALEILFYRIIIYFIFVFSGYMSFDIVEFLKRFILVRNVSHSFTHCFILFFLCIPFLNIIIQHLTQKQHKYLIFFCLFIYSFFRTVPGFLVSMNYVSWFCVLFFISSYLRLYSFPHKGEAKYWLKASIISILLASLSVLAIKFFRLSLPPYRFVSDSNAIFAVIVAFCTFNLFNNINLPYNKWINWIGGSTFGVFLIHTNGNIMRQWLWKEAIQCVEHFNTSYYALYAIISVLVIFFVCTLIDRIRILTLEKWTFDFLDKYIPQWTIKL